MRRIEGGISESSAWLTRTLAVDALRLHLETFVECAAHLSLSEAIHAKRFTFARLSQP